MGDNLKQKTVTGVMWSAAERFSALFIQAIVGLVIAHYVAPEEFGLMGIILIFIAICQVVVDSGFCTALIQKKQVHDLDYSSVFYINLTISLLLYALAFAFAPLLGEIYDLPRLGEVARVTFLILPLSALSLVQNVKLQRELHFNKLSLIGIVSTLVSAAIGLYLALIWQNVWALVFQNLTYHTAKMALLWIYGHWHPLRKFSRASVESVLPLAMSMLGSSMIGSICDNIYGLIIGKMNVRELGLYTQADKLRKIPSSSITEIVSKVAFPAMSKIQDDDNRLREAYSRIIQITFYVLAPIMIYLAVESRDIFTLLLPPKWSGCILYFSLLCIVGLFYPLHNINLNIIIVKKRGKLYLNLEIARKTTLLLILIISAHYGVIGIIIGQMVYNVIVLFLNMHFSGSLIGYSVGRQLSDLMPVVLCAALIIPISWWVQSMGMWELYSLLAAGALSAIAYLGASALMHLRPYQELSLIINHLIHGNKS